MNGLVNFKFSRTYNPSGRQNTLSEIKRLLTSRDLSAQTRACTYLIEVGNYKRNSDEKACMVEYLLENDIIVFLCEAICNLDFTLFRSVLTCIRLLWRQKRFFEEQHAANAMSAVVRALAHYAGIDSNAAINVSLHFLCDLLNGISFYESTSPLSHQSAYNTEQLLACLNALAQTLQKNPKDVLCCALVLHALISYQPPNLIVRACTVNALTRVLNPWMELLVGALNHTVLLERTGFSGMLLIVTSQIGRDMLRLIDVIRNDNQQIGFIQSILTDEQEVNALKEAVADMTNCVQRTASELVVFVKENQNQIDIEEYCVFLKFLLDFIYHNSNTEYLIQFCDMLFVKEYLTMLPKYHITSNDSTVRKISSLVLGEMLKILTIKYLYVNETDNNEMCVQDIQVSLMKLQTGIENPQSMGGQLQKSQSYSLLIYIYFYCQSSENPDDVTSSLLPYLVEFILHLPKTFKPPSCIVKALWLVYAMSVISNDSLRSLEERVNVEKATYRLLLMLRPEPSIFYTHNPAILLWAFSSQRISTDIRTLVLTQWLKYENSLPDDLARQFDVWEHLLNILIQSRCNEVVLNCMEALHTCLNISDDKSKLAFASMVWSMLPEILPKALIDYDCDIETNMCYLMEIATTLLPSRVEQSICLKTAVVLVALFTKNNSKITMGSLEVNYHYEYVCLKLCLILLGVAHKQNDNRVLLTYTNREDFLMAVLSATRRSDESVACAALQLLTYIVRYFTGNNYQPKSMLQIQTDLIVKSLRKDSVSERGVLMLDLICTMLNFDTNSPLVLTTNIEMTPPETQQWIALRALMFRTQITLCCKDSENQRKIGWKTLNAIFKYAIVHIRDVNLVSILTSQPWTHTLIRFQLTQNVTEEFLKFVHDWLTLLQISIIKSQNGRKLYLSKYNPITRTLMSMKNNLAIEDEELQEIKQKIDKVIENIANSTCIILK
ncbi:uncharacterized protein [Battus philenor]|uniref:uncharacterized protein n=1 Tax=Battus philenor TaxID=42288 RepID=UPI0035D085BE